MSDFTIHVIDDDDAARDGLVFLLTTSNFAVQDYHSGLSVLGRNSRRGQGLCDHRSKHAGDERNRSSSRDQGSWI